MIKAKSLLALGFSAHRRDLCPSPSRWEKGIQASRASSCFSFGFVLFPWLGMQLPAGRSHTAARWVGGQGWCPRCAPPGVSHHPSDHRDKALCPHLRFLFPSLKDGFLQGNPLQGRLGSRTSFLSCSEPLHCSYRPLSSSTVAGIRGASDSRQAFYKYLINTQIKNKD